MSVTLSSVEGIPEVTVVGEIDIATAPRLDEMIKLAQERGAGSGLIVSLQRCDYCDSTGLSVLIRHSGTIRDFRVVIPPESHVRRIVRVANLEERLGVVNSVADALRLIRSETPAVA